MLLLSPKRTTSLAHLIRDYITQTILGEQYRSLSSWLCSFLHFPVTSSLLCPNILLDTLSLLSYLNVSDPYKATGKIIFLCILIFKFLDSKQEDRRFHSKDLQYLSCPATHNDGNTCTITVFVKKCVVKIAESSIFSVSPGICHVCEVPN